MEHANQVNEEEEDFSSGDSDRDICYHLIPDNFRRQIGPSFNSRCLFNIDKAPLHPKTCIGIADELVIMSVHLKSDPESLERVHWFRLNMEDRYRYLTDLRPLHMAAEMGHVSCVKFLLDAGADVNVSCEESDHNALECALYEAGNDDNTAEIIELLISKGSPVSASDHKIHNWLSYAISFKPKSALVLLKYGSSILYTAEYTKKCISFALRLPNYRLYLIKMLLLAGLDLKAPDNSDSAYSLLHRHLAEVEKDKVLRFIELYYQFGGKLCVKENGETVVDLLLRHEQYDELMLKERVDYIKEKMSTPLNLSSLARLSIRSSMGRHYLNNIDLLPVPKDIQSFLRYDEIKIDPSE